MNTKTKKLGLFVCTLSLSACGTMKPYHDTSYYSPYSFGESSHPATAPLYPDGYDNTSGSTYTSGSRERVVAVPDSYHVSSESAPASFKDREKSWVGRQNTQN